MATLVKKKARKKYGHGKTYAVFEYPMQEKSLVLGHLQISGRHPHKGRVFNEKVKLIAYILKGKGEIVVEGEKNKVSLGDCILIPAKERYYYDGKMELIITCVPAWDYKQHRYCA